RRRRPSTPRTRRGSLATKTRRHEATQPELLRGFVASWQTKATSEDVPHAELERERLLVLVAREHPRQPIAGLVFEEHNLVVLNRAAQAPRERQIRAI